MTELSLGVEEELHLFDRATGRLAHRAPELLALLPPTTFTPELQRSTIEINTAVTATLDDLHSELVHRRRELILTAAQLGMRVAAVGTPPTPDAMAMTDSARFDQMRRDYRVLVDEQLICGTQVHVGVGDRELAVELAGRLSAWLPTLLALSASSPFWRGIDTGYASARTLIWQRWPTAGAFGTVDSAAQYDHMLAELVASGVIADTKMAYFDVRPSEHVPTIELRVCDACPRVDDVVMIAGLFRALVAAEIDAVRAGRPRVDVAAPLYRAAMWRAARSGLEGDLLDLSRHGRPAHAEAIVRQLLDHVRDPLERSGDAERVRRLTRQALRRGSCASRQRAAFRWRRRLSDVVDLVIAETQGSVMPLGARPLPAGVQIPRQRQSLTEQYPAPAGDEVLGPDRRTSLQYQGILQAVDDGGSSVLREQAARRDARQAELGLIFRVGEVDQLFPVDLMPRIVDAGEWAMLRSGLQQRARVLELFLRDVYSDQRAIRDGVIPADVVRCAPGWSDAGLRIPAGALRAQVVGVDLVRNESGQWVVLEDNLRIPSGLGYALSIRRLMDEVMADLPRPTGLLDAADAPFLLRDALQASAGPAAQSPPRLVLLSSGPHNAAWFEHRLLAQTIGMELAVPSDLLVRDGRVRLVRNGSEHAVDVLYVRVDAHEIGDMPGADGLPLGEPFWQVVESGRVAIANAPGNGVADDKAVYAYVPALTQYYLGEQPLLDSVPTYACREPQQRAMVLERLAELVIKPVDGYGGGGVLIGPDASAQELHEAREQILADPHRWIAQDLVPLSWHPTFDGRRLSPRHVDLRAFVYQTGIAPGDAHVASAALTRVAPAGSMVVNSSRGGGAKDTWLLG